jgi:hypothetical protein
MRSTSHAYGIVAGDEDHFDLVARLAPDAADVWNGRFAPTD